MRAEELWLVAANIWFAAIWLSVKAPLWIPVSVASICVALAVSIYVQRAKYKAPMGRTK